MGTLFLFRLDLFPGGGYDVCMAIYTTELLTDRDYNIPEGRLPLEYAVDTANKAKTHSENAEVHVTAEEKAAWNATAEDVSGLENALLDQWEEDQTTRLMQLGSLSGSGSSLPIFNNCTSFTYATNIDLMFNEIVIVVRTDDIPSVRVNGVAGVNKSFTAEHDYFYMVYRFPVGISMQGDLTFTITGANSVGGGASSLFDAPLRFDNEKDWGYYPFVELRDTQIIQHKGIKTKVWRVSARDAQGLSAPMDLTDDFKIRFETSIKSWESNGWAHTTLDWGTLSLDETTPVLLGFTVEIYSEYEDVERALRNIEEYYKGYGSGSTLRRVRLR